MVTTMVMLRVGSVGNCGHGYDCRDKKDAVHGRAPNFETINGKGGWRASFSVDRLTQVDAASTLAVT
jgi:hypothetical protein